MNLSMLGDLGAAYKSGSQSARVVTESWGAENFYCSHCESPKLTLLKHNTEARDYQCDGCGVGYQLKSQKTRIGAMVMDGAYAAMMRALSDDRAPSVFVMHYDRASWQVRNLLLIPHFAFPASAIIKRKPLAPTARRAGWVGCNFALHRIPVEARIPLVTESIVLPPAEVRARFKRVEQLQRRKLEERSWAFEVLNVVRQIADRKLAGDPASGGVVTNLEVYAFKDELGAMFPNNKNVKAKIRQKLQVLAQKGFLMHVHDGEWALR